MKLSAHSSPALNHLQLELRWLGSLLTLRLREMQAIGLLPGVEDSRPGTIIYPQEVEARLRSLNNSLSALDKNPSDPSFDEPIALARARVAAVEAERSDFLDQEPSVEAYPLLFLRKQFALGEAEYRLLLLAIGPEYDPGLPRIYAYLQNHFERQYASLALFVDCFVEEGESSAFRDLVDPDSALIRNKLVQLQPLRPGQSVPYQALLVPTRVLRFVTGDQRIDPEIEPFCQLLDGDLELPELLLPANDVAPWRRIREHLDACGARLWDLPVFVFAGPEGVGKQRRAFELARMMGKRLLLVDFEGLKTNTRYLADALATIRREADLQQALLCLVRWEEAVYPGAVPIDDPNATAGMRSSLSQLERLLDSFLATFTSTLVICTQSPRHGLPRLRERSLETLLLSLPEPAVAEKLWQQALPLQLCAEELELRVLSEYFRLTPGQIAAAARDAIHALPRSAPDARIDNATLFGTIKEQIRHRLSEHATHIDKAYRWSDLIVSKEVQTQLQEMIGRFRHRKKVLDAWGFGKRFGSELGLSALFDGPPGTGKTMSASLVAGELGLDLYQIDLSRVVSRYVGETEKNLSRIFDEAERAQAMLLFDEADSLFGSRTEVKSANDRYANLEVNYLLQRIEHFSGVAILTTNFPAAIDDAFARRLSMRVSFAKPNHRERKRLWQSMLDNQELPREAIDYDELAEDFELSGGHIRNAILRAAFIAASSDRILDQEILYLAGRIEMKELGMLVYDEPDDERLDDDDDAPDNAEQDDDDDDER